MPSDDMLAPLLRLGEYADVNDEKKMSDGTNGTTTLHGEPVDLRDVIGVHTDAAGEEWAAPAGEGEWAAEETMQPTPMSVEDQSTSRCGGRRRVGVGVWRNRMTAALGRGSRAVWTTAAKVRSSLPLSRRRSSLPSVSSSSAPPPPSAPASSITSSLAFSGSTPTLITLLLPLSLILNHVLFYRAQTAPMWNLAYAANIDVWANATSLKSRATWKALGLDDDFHFEYHDEAVLETFTYMDAINKLWEAKGLDDKTVSQLGAVLLVIFSGFWPHIKLVMLHLSFLMPFRHKNRGGGDRCGTVCCGPKSSTYRTPLLRTISSLGKWSLADVFVVCVMIAVLHLDWEVDPETIRSGVETELPTLLQYAKTKYPSEVLACEALLKYRCGKHAQVKHYGTCYPCEGVIKNAYAHPGWATSEGKDILDGLDVSGGGHAQLRVRGMKGSYLFCGAVVMSVCLSLLVDLMDWRDGRRVEREYDALARAEEDAGGEEMDGENVDEGERRDAPRGGALNDAFMVDRPSNASSSRHSGTRNASRVTRPSPPPSPTTNSKLLGFTIMWLFSIVCPFLVYYAVTTPTMARVVHGGVPKALHEVLGVVWDRTYSVVELVRTTGDAGGWDNFLMGTFGWFVVVGPMLRALLVGLNAVLAVPLALLGECVERPRSRTFLRTTLFRAINGLRRSILRPLIDASGAFCAWEVLIVAVVMVQLEMPSITDTIYKDDRCEEADPENGRTCVEVQFNALDEFLLIAVAWAVLVAAATLAVNLAHTTRRRNGGGGEKERDDLVEFEWGQEVRVDERSHVYDPMRPSQRDVGGEARGFVEEEDPASITFV